MMMPSCPAVLPVTSQVIHASAYMGSEPGAIDASSSRASLICRRSAGPTEAPPPKLARTSFPSIITHSPAPATVPDLLHEDPILMRLDALETSICNNDQQAALRRVADI
jgi:hypothetical protein